MKTLYLDCSMGAAGDMLSAALAGLLPSPEAFIERMGALGIPGAEFSLVKRERCGIAGLGFSVKINGIEEGDEAEPPGHHHEGRDHHHHHGEDGHHHHHEDRNHHGEREHQHARSGMQEIEALFASLDLPAEAKKDALAVYSIIAQAESEVHGKPVSQIHFHEVGALDAVADIAAVSLLMREIAPDRVVASPVCTGSGTVRCAHGILPVPAPATALILKGVPAYAGDIKGEMCTPTGAALVRHFADEFAEMPLMKVSAVGYGMGKRDFGERANCLRALLGDSPEREEGGVIEISCNIDDMTAEALAFAVERIFAAGALDAFTAPVSMKKGRTGALLSVLCLAEEREKILKAIFAYTTTIGARERALRRHVLERREETVLTAFGEARRKVSAGFGVTRAKWEADDISRIARERNIGFDEARRLLDEASKPCGLAAKDEGNG